MRLVVPGVTFNINTVVYPAKLSEALEQLRHVQVSADASAVGAAANLNRVKMQILSKRTLVCGESVTVFSCDGERWFSNRHDAELCEQRREKFFSKALRGKQSFFA